MKFGKRDRRCHFHLGEAPLRRFDVLMMSISLFSMYNMHGSGGIDELLKKDNVSLEEILDEENLLVEMKNATSKVHGLYVLPTSP